jgi:aryl-alcohol dehydrogenase-like predicted oxidoreductase
LKGISDAPAWVVSKANQYARDHGKTPFVIYQGEWNVMKRSFERDIIPMVRCEGAYQYISRLGYVISV